MIAPALLLPRIVELVDAAGEVIMSHYAKPTPAETKGDGSPVTLADKDGEGVITGGLESLTPGIPIVAEERVSEGQVPDLAGQEFFWLVDPLDGTKEFISKNGEFTVNVALIQGDAPLLGVVGAPAFGALWWGVRGHGASRRDADGTRDIRARSVPAGGATALVSRSHLDPATERFLQTITVADTMSAGSSLKFCRIADGVADVYPRFGRTMEWDTGAGDAVLRAAGGRVQTTEGEVFTYRKPGFANDGGFIAWGA
ncbi:MAG: 3'(2'),5'-bisphosphate nucleotidase CysQ [Geminicoccaceae bacterium]